MIIWINGPFGGGKTTLADLLAATVEGSMLYDPEEVGFMLRNLLPGHAKDFQDLPPWRPLVAATGVELHHLNQGRPLIAPMTLLNRDYAHEIFTAIDHAGIPLRHLLVHTDTPTLLARIDASMECPGDETRSEKVRAFRRRRLTAYEQALGTWLRDEADIIDTTTLTPRETLEQALKTLDRP
ncbi:AAA family ATPase (plasmid) [Embleya sp. NBC_00888]|uniref:AAA family ATPase n=1 Tax=Embleya sp. NBC_00888 TaxID=2975960 RepID=UPI002F913A66|nr:AAA family ATPase [Embleya sp. NBC_00888]